MRFRPCIDLHNGRVKLMTEAGLTGEATPPLKDASFYAAWYAMHGYGDGFLMLHNRDKDPIFEKTFAEAKKVLFARPDTWSVGGKMTPEIAEEVLREGARKAVFGSYVFRAGGPDPERLKKIKNAFGKERIILHLRFVRRDSSYYLLSGALDHGTGRQITEETLDSYAAYCSELVVETPGRERMLDDAYDDAAADEGHENRTASIPGGIRIAGPSAPGVAGTSGAIEAPLVLMLAKWNKLPVTYLRGVNSETGLNLLEQMGQEKLDFSVGGALDLYGGDMPEHLLTYFKGV